MRALASSNLSANVVEIRLVKFPHGVRRIIKIIDTPQSEVTIATPDVDSPLTSYLSVTTGGLTLAFTYTGPLVPASKLVKSSVTIIVPRTFMGFIDSRYN